MAQKPCFISIEGVEGVGKSTAMGFLQQRLSDFGVEFVTTREPGGTPIAEEIRQVLLQEHDEIMSPDTELLLMFAGRAQNIARVIRPALQRGQWVIADRFADASFAYQGGGRGIPLKHIAELSEWVLGDLQPDMTLLLDAPVKIGFNRLKKRGVKDRIEMEGMEFFERVRQRYLIRAGKFPERFRVIDATQPIEQVKQAIFSAIEPLFSEVVS